MAILKCLKCNNEFKINPAAIKRGRGKYCSRSCYYKSIKGKQLSEEIKIKMLGRKPWNFNKQMSDEQRVKLSGKNHWNWQDGISTINERIRKSFLYRQWRSDVFTRDDYTCQFCGEKGGSINADHIKPFAVILNKYSIKNINDAENCAELWNINNGRTLCISCHKNTDTYGNKKKYDTI